MMAAKSWVSLRYGVFDCSWLDFLGHIQQTVQLGALGKPCHVGCHAHIATPFLQTALATATCTALSCNTPAPLHTMCPLSLRNLGGGGCNMVPRGLGYPVCLLSTLCVCCLQCSTQGQLAVYTTDRLVNQLTRPIHPFHPCVGG